MSQMTHFAKSLLLYAQGKDSEVRHYPGQYTRCMALDLARTIPLDAPLWFWAKASGRRMRMTQEQDLRAFGVEFDTWAHESHLNSYASNWLDDKFADGLIWETGINGIPICGNCAAALAWVDDRQGRCAPCPLCTNAGRYRQPWEGHANPMSRDPALSPENDFMPETI